MKTLNFFNRFGLSSLVLLLMLTFATSACSSGGSQEGDSTEQSDDMPMDDSDDMPMDDSDDMPMDDADDMPMDSTDMADDEHPSGGSEHPTDS